MEQGVGKPPFFDGTNYPYWKIHMSAYLQSIRYRVWEICLDANFDATSDQITPIQMEFHDSNNKARNTLFSCLSLGEFERVGHLTTAYQIWSTIERFHEGNDHVKTRLFETYRREYENFTQLARDTIDYMFSWFQSIVNKMRANKAHLPYSDHERAPKLLHALDRRVWEVKVSAIVESPNYETLTVDELFSKLKYTEIDHQTRAKIENPGSPTMALVFGGGSASNSSPAMFALSSLLSITEEQVESLGDEELALVASRFTQFHNKRMSRQRGGSKDRCYNCDDPDHFVASCPKKGKSESSPRDHHSGRCKGKYSSDKYKSKGGFDKEALKKKYLQKAKIKECAFLASLSDLDQDSDDGVSSSSDKETERRVEGKLNRLCFIADTLGGFCTMALGEDAVGTGDDKDIGDDTTSKVLRSADDLADEIEELNAALASQDKLLRHAAYERREFRSKYESTLRKLEFPKASVVVSDETECDECALHMSNITTFQTKYSTLLDEHDEMRSLSCWVRVPFVLGCSMS
jgi:hypothetical protein